MYNELLNHSGLCMNPYLCTDNVASMDIESTMQFQIFLALAVMVQHVSAMPCGYHEGFKVQYPEKILYCVNCIW